MTDAGLNTLAGMTALQRVGFTGTKVIEAGVRKFAAPRPALTVVWGGRTIGPAR